MKILDTIKSICDCILMFKKQDDQQIKNKVFNENLNKNTKISDCIRKQKQQKIQKNLLKVIIIICLITCGCFSTKVTESDIIEECDIYSLKTTETTYRIVDNTVVDVYDSNKKTQIKFNQQWFVVHSDLLKTMNENQDLLIKLTQKDDNVLKIICIILSICLTFIIILEFKKHD